MHVLIIYI